MLSYCGPGNAVWAGDETSFPGKIDSIWAILNNLGNIFKQS